MTERSPDPLAELLRSPLDTEREPRRLSRRDRDEPPSAGLPSIALMITGAVIVLLGFTVGRVTDEPEASTTTTTTTTTTVPQASFPDGYVPVSDLVALRAERLTAQGDRLFMTVSVAALESIDPTRSAPFGGGEWELELDDGRTISSSGSIFDDFAPGVFSVIFPLEGFEPSDAAAARLTAVWLRNEAFPTIELGSEDVLTLPFESGELVVALDERTQLSASVILTDDGGTVEWTIDGAARGATVAAAAFLYEGFNDRTPIVMQSIGPGFSFAGIRPSITSQTTEGTLELTAPTTTAGQELLRIELTWTVSWTTTTPADVVVPLDSALRD